MCEMCEMSAIYGNVRRWTMRLMVLCFRSLRVAFFRMTLNILSGDSFLTRMELSFIS